MAIIQQSNNGAAFSSLLAPFTGVNNGSARLLKAISASELATLRNGDRVYVESVRDYWKWVPLSVIASDDITYCSPTVVGVGAGRFERLFIVSPDWQLQTAWFVDSTAINQEGDGSALNPLQSDVELARRWGKMAILSQPTTITYAQSPASTTNFNIFLLGGSISFLGVATDTAPAVISAVTALNRVTQTPWDITAPGLGAAHIGLIIEIVASAVPANVGAYAVVLKDLGGGRVRISPFGTRAFNTAAPFTNITPTVGDTVVVHSTPTLNVGSIIITPQSNASVVASPLANAAVFDLINLNGNVDGASNGAISSHGCTVFMCRVMAIGLKWSGIARGANVIIAAGGGTKTSLSTIVGTQILNAFSMGCLSTIGMVTGSTFTPKQDCTFQACTINTAIGSRILSAGTAYFDSASSGLTVASMASYQQTSTTNPDWGTNNAIYGIRVQSGGQYEYSTKPIINSGLGVGCETLVGGTDKLYAALPYVEGANLASITLQVA